MATKVETCKVEDANYFQYKDRICFVRDPDCVIDGTSNKFVLTNDSTLIPHGTIVQPVYHHASLDKSNEYIPVSLHKLFYYKLLPVKFKQAASKEFFLQTL